MMMQVSCNILGKSLMMCIKWEFHLFPNGNKIFFHWKSWSVETKPFTSNVPVLVKHLLGKFSDHGEDFSCTRERDLPSECLLTQWSGQSPGLWEIKSLIWIRQSFPPVQWIFKYLYEAKEHKQEKLRERHWPYSVVLERSPGLTERNIQVPGKTTNDWTLG